MLQSNREEAEAAGVFGVTSLVVDGELFWGQDRLDMALAKAGISPP
jgi:2-hydroxychromene-2-carboxylate isomerase